MSEESNNNSAELDLGKVMGSKIHNVSAAPASSLGLVDDWAMNTTNGDVYEKTSNGWTLRGNFKGPKGDTGNTGPAAGFGTISADIDANTGTPAVTVETGGTDQQKSILFHFQNLKGPKGDKGDNGDASVQEFLHTGMYVDEDGYLMFKLEGE
jgi:hypothetical protein